METARSLEEVDEIYDAIDQVLNTGLAEALGRSIVEIEAAVAQGLDGVNRLLRERTKP